MVQVIVVVRELGKRKPHYSLRFDLPEVPKIGSYLSINRPDTPEPYSEDLVVRAVWWRLFHPEIGPVVPNGNEKIGGGIEIFVECDPAIGPYAKDSWRDRLQAAKRRGLDVEEFPVERSRVRQSALPTGKTVKQNSSPRPRSQRPATPGGSLAGGLRSQGLLGK
jgi:hypothetical protein